MRTQSTNYEALNYITNIGPLTGNTVTTVGHISFSPKQDLIGRLFKENKITMDEMLLLLDRQPQIVYPQIPTPTIVPWYENPFQVTSYASSGTGINITTLKSSPSVTLITSSTYLKN